jgi:hypothetical protein
VGVRILEEEKRKEVKEKKKEEEEVKKNKMCNTASIPVWSENRNYTKVTLCHSDCLGLKRI